MSVVAYADASALVKLVVIEPESPGMHRWYVEAQRVATSRIGIVETFRASSRYPVDVAHLDRVLADLDVLELTNDIAARARSVGPASVRTLDAIHLATALSLGVELDAFVTYDDRLAAAARDLGLPVIRPA